MYCSCLAVLSISSDNNPSDSLSPFLNIPVTSNQAKYLVHCLEQCLISFSLPLGSSREQSWQQTCPFAPFDHTVGNKIPPRRVSNYANGVVDKKHYYSVKLFYLCLPWCFLSTAVLLFIACLFCRFLWFSIPTTLESLCSFSHLPQHNQHSDRLLDICWCLWHLIFCRELP